MKFSPITFGQLRRLLHELHFTEKRDKRGWQFEEPDSGTIFLFRPYKENDKLNNVDLLSTRTHLEWRGLLDPAAFENFLNKTPA